MPIWAMWDYSESHWGDVLWIIKDVVNQTEFNPSLVSDSDDVTIIHKNIIHNIYHNEIVICDVSWKNPNVMFELGMRLAFDKPTIIIKDDKTNYSFDTWVIEHLTYPKDLRFTEIVKFKEKLEKKIVDTYKKSISDPDYSTFLKHFWEYKIAKIDEKEVSSDEYLISELKSIKNEIHNLKGNNRYIVNNSIPWKSSRQMLLDEYIDKFRKIKKYWIKDRLTKQDEEDLFKLMEDDERVQKAFDHPDRLRDAITIDNLPF